MAVAALFLVTLSIATGGTPRAAEKEIRVGIYQNQPKIFLDADGQPSGFFPDILDHIAGTLGLKATYVPCEWAECLEKLQSGEIDLMPDVARTPGREQLMSFGHEAALHSWSYFYTRPDAVLRSFADLNGKRVAVLENSGQHKELEKLSAELNIRPAILPRSSFAEAFAAVRDGDADVAVVNKYFGEEFEAQYRLRRSLLPAFLPGQLFLAYPPNADRQLIAKFDLELAMLKADPRSIYYRELQRWFERRRAQVVPDWVIWVLLGASALLATGWGGVLWLRRKVKERTAELRKSDARFRSYTETSSDFYWETDENLKISRLAESFSRITGRPADKFIGKTHLELGNPGVDEKSWSEHLEDLQARRPFRDFVVPILKPDGSTVWISSNGMPAFDAAGAFLGYRGTGKDISARRKAENEMKFALEVAHRASLAKSDFLATMSHELRTPLNAILGFSELLQSQFLGPLGSPTYEEYVNDIRASGTHLLHLVENVLDVSAIEAGKRNLRKRDVAVRDAVRNAVRQFIPISLGENITFSEEIAEDVSTICVDESAFGQVLLNLLSNAVKFAGKNGKVWISAVRSGNAVLVSIKDTGPGIPEEMLPRLGRPFETGQSDPRLSQKGVGLGLAVVKSLVELHGGTVVFRSEVGAGTEVTVSFPIRSPERGETAEAVAQRPEERVENDPV